MGNLIEECYFGYKANSDSGADFAEAGVELKVTPYKETRKGYATKERLVRTMINYMEIVKERDFEHSHVWDWRDPRAVPISSTLSSESAPEKSSKVRVAVMGSPLAFTPLST